MVPDLKRIVCSSVKKYSQGIGDNDGFQGDNTRGSILDEVPPQASLIEVGTGKGGSIRESMEKC